MERARVASIVHLDFVARLYQEQLDGGRYLLHEHPRYATSWSVPSIAKILSRDDVRRAHGDKGQPIQKPTGFMTNSEAVARALSLR